LIDRFTKNTLS